MSGQAKSQTVNGHAHIYIYTHTQRHKNTYGQLHACTYMHRCVHLNTHAYTHKHAKMCVLARRFFKRYGTMYDPAKMVVSVKHGGTIPRVSVGQDGWANKKCEDTLCDLIMPSFSFRVQAQTFPTLNLLQR